MYKVEVVDWGDDAYRKFGCEQIIETFYTDASPGFCYDGGRLEIDGFPDTIWVYGSQWSVRVTKE